MAVHPALDKLPRGPVRQAAQKAPGGRRVWEEARWGCQSGLLRQGQLHSASHLCSVCLITTAFMRLKQGNRYCLAACMARDTPLCTVQLDISMHPHAVDAMACLYAVVIPANESGPISSSRYGPCSTSPSICACQVYERILAHARAGHNIAGSCFWLIGSSETPDWDGTTVYPSSPGPAIQAENDKLRADEAAQEASAAAQAAEMAAAQRPSETGSVMELLGDDEAPGALHYYYCTGGRGATSWVTKGLHQRRVMQYAAEHCLSANPDASSD